MSKLGNPWISDDPLATLIWFSRDQNLLPFGGQLCLSWLVLCFSCHLSLGAMHLTKLLSWLPVSSVFSPQLCHSYIKSLPSTSLFSKGSSFLYLPYNPQVNINRWQICWPLFCWILFCSSFFLIPKYWTRFSDTHMKQGLFTVVE